MRNATVLFIFVIMTESYCKYCGKPFKAKSKKKKYCSASHRALYSRWSGTYRIITYQDVKELFWKKQGLNLDDQNAFEELIDKDLDGFLELTEKAERMIPEMWRVLSINAKKIETFEGKYKVMFRAK